jgi:hypothetical protein
MTEQVASLGDHLALAPLERSLEVPHPLAGGDHVAERSLPALISGHPFSASKILAGSARNPPA